MNQPKTILLIDDDRTILYLLARMFREEGFEILNADNGEDGIALVQQRRPDLIICDVNMPEMDGYQVLDALRQDAEIATIPFIFLTGSQGLDAARLGMNLGADDFLTKPFTPEELLGAVHARLRKRAILQEQADRRMDDLRSNIVRALPHEFRTPLSIILGYSDLLARDYGGQIPEVGRMSQSINNAANRLYKLVEKFWAYTETEVLLADGHIADRLNNLEPYYPGELVTVEARALAAIHRREGDLILNVQDAITHVAEDHLRRIIQEILDNAFKFSEVGTPVELAAYSEQGYWQLRVTDQGRGMTPDQIAHIGAYVQFDRQYYEQQGAGLGLVIAQRLIQLYGGAYSVTSAPDAGTCVSIALPLAV
jgi:two-component system sensor histidine kinase/response regulator